jgi:iron complex transport system ATP-binding protein
MTQVASVSNVVVTRSNNDILGPISFTLSEGERWVILGPNGAGKSTLLKLLATDIHPTKGVVTLLGRTLGRVDVFELRTRIGICASMKHEQIPSDEIVKDVVLTSAYAVIGRWNEAYDLWDESRASALLTTFGVRDLADRLYATLSDGERKRVQIARALMSDPELLLLDEPTAGLDMGGREDLLARFASFANDLRAPVTVTVTHHLEEIPAGTTHALLLKDGKVAISGPVNQVVTSEHVSAVFGIKMEVVSQNGRFFARAI